MKTNLVLFLAAAHACLALANRFVASCQRVGVDPFAWLRDVLSRIAHHPITRLAELMPHNYTPVQA